MAGKGLLDLKGSVICGLTSAFELLIYTINLLREFSRINIQIYYQVTH